MCPLTLGGKNLFEDSIYDDVSKPWEDVKKAAVAYRYNMRNWNTLRPDLVEGKDLTEEVTVGFIDKATGERLIFDVEKQDANKYHITPRYLIDKHHKKIDVGTAEYNSRFIDNTNSKFAMRDYTQETTVTKRQLSNTVNDMIDVTAKKFKDVLRSDARWEKYKTDPDKYESDATKKNLAYLAQLQNKNTQPLNFSDLKKRCSPEQWEQLLHKVL